MKLRDIPTLLKETFQNWQKDKAAKLAAALAYYTAFSIAPLLIIVIAIVAVFFGQDAAQGHIVQELQKQVGTQAAAAIQTIIQHSRHPVEGTIASILSLVLLLFGASGVFTELQDSLNTIWKVTPKPGQGIKTAIKSRLSSFVLVLGIGFLLLVSLILSTALTSIATYFNSFTPNLVFLWQAVNFVVSFGVVMILFAMIYRILPDVKIAWSDVWLGAAITSLLFTIGKYLLGLYLGNSSVSSPYGAAGSFVVMLLWVNYSAQILFFGAEFTQVYANKYGSKIVPDDDAVPLTNTTEVEQVAPKNARPGNQFAPTSNKRQTKQHQTIHSVAIALSILIGAYQFLAPARKTKIRRKRFK